MISLMGLIPRFHRDLNRNFLGLLARESNPNHRTGARGVDEKTVFRCSPVPQSGRRYRWTTQSKRATRHASGRVPVWLIPVNTGGSRLNWFLLKLQGRRQQDEHGHSATSSASAASTRPSS